MGRAHGFWWSPGSDFLAYEEADTSPIPIFRIPHPGEDDPHAVEEHRYPFAGEANARVRLGVISRAGGETAWMDLGDPEGDAHYLARVDWLPDGGLTAQLENRAQTRLELDRFDPQTGTRRTLLVETSPLWINLHNLFRPLKSGGWVWGSERTGFRHLYLYGADGALQRPLTAGEWMVDAVAGVDEDAGIVYFTASWESPTESQLYAVDFGGGEPRRLTSEPGMHSPVMDHACARFVDTSDSITHPPVVQLRSKDGEFLAAIFENRDPRLAELALPAPEIVSLTNRAGDTLYGAVFRPPERFGRGPHPTLVHVYGGPHVQLVQNSWKLAASLRAQYLASLGYLVFTLDNRGSARRGLAFEGAIHRQVGSSEVEDQVDGVRWLVSRGLSDPQRVGIYGWSYGGYMSAICLARAPETFRAAVAGAPVTHEAGYDTHYTERYMSTPQDNPEGYRASSVMTYVDEMRGQLLLVHGLIDENVHFRHTARLINSLIKARKPYDLFLFPDERHMPRG
ncbi:MAG TPA: DPP IV N-terminal domain-containing protein, partial [Longimicrobiales bacterium]